MASTTINRGNVLYTTAVQASLGATTVSGASTEVTLTVPGVATTDIVRASFAGAQTTGVGIGNAYASAANTVKVQLLNTTGSSATSAAGTLLLLISSPEANPLPTSVV